MGGSPGCSGVVSGRGDPGGDFPEPVGGTPGCLHTYPTTRTLLLAQNQGWTSLAVIFGIALGDVNTLDQWLYFQPRCISIPAATYQRG